MRKSKKIKLSTDKTYAVTERTVGWYRNNLDKIGSNFSGLEQDTMFSNNFCSNSMEILADLTEIPIAEFDELTIADTVLIWDTVREVNADFFEMLKEKLGVNLTLVAQTPSTS